MSQAQPPLTLLPSPSTSCPAYVDSGLNEKNVTSMGQPASTGVTLAMDQPMGPTYAGLADGFVTAKTGPNAWLALAAKIVVAAVPEAQAPWKTTGASSVPLAQARPGGQAAIPD